MTRITCALVVVAGAGLLAPQVTFCQSRVTLANTATSLAVRSLLDEPARLIVEEVPLVTALSELAETSGVPLVFSPSLLAARRTVTCLCRSVSVGQALLKLLDSTSFSFREVGGQVAIVPAGASTKEDLDATPPSVVAPGSYVPVRELVAAPSKLTLDSTQQPVVTGLVLDARSRPIVAATVLIVGTNNRAQTDATGRFRLGNVSGNEVTLRVTAIGYEPLSRSVQIGANDIRLVLNAAVVNLEEMIVTGTPGAVQKRSLGNSIAEIDAAKVVEQAPPTSVGQLINARAPGVSVQTGSGVRGSGPRINIRGQSSLVFAGDPLIYVDGVRVDNSVATGPAIQGGNTTSRLNDFSPEEIERIEIIKGPAAATLYGTEASNGVIQIITKKGRAAPRPVIGMTVRQGATWFMNPEGRWPTRWGTDPTTGQIVGINFAQRETDRGTPLFRTGQLQAYALNVGGGSESARYYVAGELNHDEGIEVTNRAQHFGGRANLSFTPRRGLEIEANTGVSIGRTKLSREDGNSIVFGAIYGNPANVNTIGRGFLGVPPEVVRAAYDLSQDVNRFTGSLRLSHETASWLSQRLVVGLDLLDQEDAVLRPLLSPEFAPFFSAFDASGSKRVDRRGVWNTTLDYGNTIRLRLSDKLGLQTSFGAQYYRKLFHLSTLQGTVFPAAGVETVGGTATRTASEDRIENVTVGVYAQQQLTWKDRLYLTGALRGDDNSAFGQDFDFVVYPKVALAWVLHEEPFLRKLSFLEAFKLRAAYGVSGQQPDAFAARQTFQPTTGPGGVGAVTPGSIGNPGLKPEQTTELEVGFDAGMFGNRVGVEFTYFRQRTKDAMVFRDVPLSAGFPGQQLVNLASVRNAGVELLLRARPLDTPLIGWDLSLNLSTAANEILDLGLPVPFLPGGVNNTLRKQAGYPINAVFVKRVVSAELGPTGNAINALCDGGPGHAPLPCAQASAVFIGSVEPKIQGAVTSTVTLGRRLSVYAMVDFRGSHYRFENNTQAAPCISNRTCEENYFPARFDPKRIAEIQLSQIGAGDYSFIYPNARFAKLREVALNYVFSERLVRAIQASRASLTVSARNLHTWTSYPALDPEATRVNNIGPTGPYIDQAQTPLPAELVVRLTLTF